MTELEPVEPLQTAQPSPDKAVPETVSPVLQESSPPPSPTAHLEATVPATTFLPPSIIEERDVSSPGSNQLAIFEAGLESPVRSPVRPEVTNEQLRTAINNLFGMLQRSSTTSRDTAQVLSSLRQTVMDEINSIRMDFARQSSSATAIVNLSGQLDRTEQRLEANIDTLGTQLSEIITFLSPADDKKGKKWLTELREVQQMSLGEALLQMRSALKNCWKKKGEGNKPRSA